MALGVGDLIQITRAQHRNFPYFLAWYESIRRRAMPAIATMPSLKCILWYR